MFYRYKGPRKARPVVAYLADTVWGAAAAAQRVNGGYFKQDVYDQSEPPKVVNRANRYIVHDYLNNPGLLTQADIEAGAEVRRYYQALTFKLLSDRYMSDFDKSALKIAEKEEVNSEFDIALIAALPACMIRAKERDSNENKVRFASGGFVGKIKEKVELEVTVTKSFFSLNYRTYFVTAITSNDQVVSFSYRQQLEVGKTYKVRGTVTAHRPQGATAWDLSDNTKINRVKVL